MECSRLLDVSMLLQRARFHTPLLSIPVENVPRKFADLLG